MAQIEKVLPHFQGVQKHSGYFIARCPAHADDKASLSLSTGDDGKVLLKCHAGCSCKDIVQAAGLKMSDLFAENGNGKVKPKIVGTYDYLDENGNLLHQTIRYFPKLFKQRRPDGNGGWIWNLQDITPVLYRLPEVLKAKTVFIVEGEKDADNLVSLGLPATTNPMGANKWRKHYNRHLEGKKVIILPDNDETGRGHAQDIASGLQGIATAVKIVTLPDLPQKGDITDWLANGGNKDKLLEIVQNTPIFGQCPTEAVKTCFSDIKIEDMTAARFIGMEPEPIKWTLQGSLRAGSLGVVVADGGTGKGFLLLQMGISKATESDFLDGQYTVSGGAGKVLLIFGEDDDAVVHNRIDGILRSFEEAAEEEDFLARLRDNLHIINVTGQDARLVQNVGGNLLPTQAYDDLLKLLHSIENLRLVVLDPLSRFYAGDEKNSPDATYFCSLMERIAQETGATVLVSQHTNKASGTGKDSLTQHAIRGSTGFTNAARWQLNIARVDPTEWRKLGIPPEEIKNYLVAKVTKKNLGPPEDYFYLRHDANGTLRLAQVDEGLSETDQEVIESIVAKVDGTKRTEGKRFTKRAFARCFARQFHNYGAHKLEKLVDHAIARNLLRLDPKTNANGINVEYLDAV